MKAMWKATVCVLVTAMFMMPISAVDVDRVDDGAGMATALTGETLYVGGSGPDNYTKIQDAIDAAHGGDTVFVYGGTYHENIVIDKPITLTGENRDSTMIKGDGTTHVVKITRSSTTITGFTIQNGGEEYPRSGVIVDYADNCDIIHNKISHNKGRGVFLKWGNHNYVDDNMISNNGGSGLRVDFSENTITNNSIHDNEAMGIFFYEGHDCLVDNNHIFHNHNGINLESSSKGVIIRNNQIDNNREVGILCCCESTNCKIVRNTIQDNNWAIRMAAITGNTIYHNNFINNIHTCYDNYDNTWDLGCPIGGNYWSDFDEASEGAYDNNSDGIIDDSYEIEGGPNEDKNPLISEYRPLHIGLQGGVGITMVFVNRGKKNLSELQWSIEIDGPIIGAESSTGTIPTLPVGNIQKTKLNLFGLGFGTITIRIGQQEETQKFYLIGPFVKIKN